MYRGDIRLPNRLGERIPYAPPGFNAVSDCLGVYPGPFSPLGKGHNYAAVSDQAAASSVAALGFPRGPDTVIRAVRTVVVNSFNRVLRGRAWTHVRKEVFKGFEPTWANKNAPATVVLPTLAARFIAADFDVAPNGPLGADASLSGHPVRGNSFSDQFSSKASATDASAVAERRSINGFFGSAIATTNPKAQPIAAKHGPSSETATSHFNEFWHDIKFTTIYGVR